MSDPKGWKALATLPALAAAVVIGLGGLFGGLAAIPYTTKSDLKQMKESYQIELQQIRNEIRDLNEVDKTLYDLKNQDNQWYREVAQDVAVMRVDINNIKEDLQEMKQLLRERK